MSHLEYFAAMGSPRVAEAPDAVLVAVEDPDLAVDGAGCAAVSVAVKSNGLDEVLVAVPQDQVALGPIIHCGRGRQRRRHGGWLGAVSWTQSVLCVSPRCYYYSGFCLDGEI